MGMALFFAICLVGATVQATPQEQEEQAEPEYTEEEYNAYEAATKEADLLKRGEMLLNNGEVSRIEAHAVHQCGIRTSSS